MGAPRCPNRAGLGGSWLCSRKQGESMPRGARYKASVAPRYKSRRSTRRATATQMEEGPKQSVGALGPLEDGDRIPRPAVCHL